MPTALTQLPMLPVSDTVRPRNTPALLLVALLLTPLAAASANGALSVAAVWTLAFVLSLLLRFGEPPVLALALFLQWGAVALPIYFANAIGRPIGEAEAMPSMALAAWLGLIALVVLAVGIQLGRGTQAVAELRQLRQVGAELSPQRLLLAYVVSLVIAHVLVPALANIMPGLRQPLGALSTLPLVIAFVILWSATISARTRALAVTLVLLNVLIGFGQYFSGFKTLVLLALVVLAGKATSLRKLVSRPMLWLLSAALLVMISFWSAVKTDYREFLNAGTASQVVLVRPSERVAYLRDKAANFGVTELQRGLELSLVRFSYLDFFAGSVANVPAHRPHTEGLLWAEAVAHVLLPRLLYPDKTAINDSDRTNTYSGFWVATAEQGASVSIGYVGESYIDFGAVGMFVPILLLGVLWGGGYRLLAHAGPVPLLNAGAAIVFILLNATLFEASNIKLVGGGLTTLLVLYPFLRYVSGPLWALLMGPQHARSRGS